MELTSEENRISHDRGAQDQKKIIIKRKQAENVERYMREENCGQDVDMGLYVVPILNPERGRQKDKRSIHRSTSWSRKSSLGSGYRGGREDYRSGKAPRNSRSTSLKRERSERHRNNSVREKGSAKLGYN